MANIFLIADTHFGHSRMYTDPFMLNDGTRLRPWTSHEEADEHMIKQWNSVVKHEDRVYLLGDIVLHRRALPVLYRLQGRKVLIKGNHDIFKLKDYLPHFDDIRAYWPLDKIMMTHIPIHPASLGRWDGNVHGHLHKGTVGDPRYLCVSVEQVDYTPIEFSVVRKHFGRT